MSKIIRFRDRQTGNDGGKPDIEEQACAWVIRLDSDDISPAELIRLRAWLKRDPAHQRAFDQATRGWLSADRLAQLRFGTDPANGDRVAAASAGESEQCPKNARRGPRRPLAVAAAIALLSLTFWLGWEWTGKYFHHNDYAAAYHTGVGESRLVSLPDGSKITINTQSEVEVDFQNEIRHVHLRSGEAYFEVAHDPRRPFIVFAGDNAIKAVGTAFTVHMLDQGMVDLTVTEGRVSVLATSPQPQTPSGPTRALEPAAEPLALLAKGHRALIEREVKSLEIVEQADIDKKLSWRDGMLIFDDDSLENVVAEINRYNLVKIVISDSELRRMKFGGYFRLDNLEDILTAMEQHYDIQADRIHPDLIYLSRANFDQLESGVAPGNRTNSNDSEYR